MTHQIFIDRKTNLGMTYEQYFEQIQQKVAKLNDENISDEVRVDLEKVKLNLQRMNRVHKTFESTEELTSVIDKINEPQIWIVLTEDWCGDSAQTIPYMYEISKLNSMIQIKILERDKNLEIMDLYLDKNNSRSIPKLIAFDEAGNELFQWGARPKEGQQLVDRLKAEGKSKEEFLEQLHLWYGRNRGKSLIQEFIELLTQVIEPIHN